MQKIYALILLSALVSNYEAFPQTKWNKQIHNSQSQLIRERRQFPFGDWVPLTQACPTCRPFADPLDVGLRSESIGLTPPKPPTVTRQVHGEGNFFPQDESSILSVPPPPPSAIPRQPVTNTNGNFRNLQFTGFSQFNSPLPIPTQQIFPQTQQIQFLPQTFLPNQQLLVNNNQQVLSALNQQSALNNPNTIFGQGNQGKGQINDGKVTKFNSEFKSQNLPQNVVLEQNRPLQQSINQFGTKPKPFSHSQQNGQQTFTIQQQGQKTIPVQQEQQPQQALIGQQQTQQALIGQQQAQQALIGQQQAQQVLIGQQQVQQGLVGQQQHSINFADSILTPPPAPTNVTQDIVIPGLDKEEVQLLYVPVETLRQRGNFQEQLISQQQPQNIQFKRPSVSQSSPISVRPTDQTTTKLPLKGHFVTHNANNHGQSLSTLKVTPAQPFPTTVTPSSLLLQQLPFSQTPQPFVSATPASPTSSTNQAFVTPSSTAQKFSGFSSETTLSHLPTIPSTLHFSHSPVEFGTTPKTVFVQENFQGQTANGKLQFNNFNVQQQPRPLQPQNQELPTIAAPQSLGGRQVQQNPVFHQERQKELEIQNQIPNKQVIDQQQIALQKQQEHQRLLQQQKEKELQEQLLLKQRQQKELEAQRLLQQQKQRELEEQKFLQIQKQKELEQQQLLQQQHQKELEEQRFLQQQRQKELEQQRFLQQQQEKELENQRRLQLQREKELEEKRQLQAIKQKEEEQRLLRLQLQQQRELEQQRLLNQQQEKQQQLLLQNQKQEQFQSQQKQRYPQQSFQQPNSHTLPANDKLNTISQLEKESEPEANQQLVPHQPPLSVFYKGQEGANARIVDVLRELRSSTTITVLDQYFEKMPKVFVGPAGLIPPAGYGKFELPYLSNIESNRIERKIDRLPFFVAPLNFVPPPGYAKIPFPAPHIGSVVVSNEANPAMNVKVTDIKQNLNSVEENASGNLPMVGPELPGLINGLETEITTVKPTFPSTPSLPQTTAQLRNRRPNTNLYRTQSRKPISKSRPTTTSKPEEEVTQPISKTEVSKDTEVGIRKPFNRFLNRRRQQSKTTTENSLQTQQEAKNLENRHYSVEVYHQQKNLNQNPRYQQKTNAFNDQKVNSQSAGEFSSIDRSTPGGHGVFEVSPTPGFHSIQSTGGNFESEGHKLSGFSDIKLQTYEDGPLPTGSAKTITQELYRPNALSEPQRPSEIPSESFSKDTSTLRYEQFQPSSEEHINKKLTKESNVNSTPASINSESISIEDFKIQPTPNVGFEKDISIPSSEKYFTTELPKAENLYTPGSFTGSQKQTTNAFGSSDEYTSAFAEISKHYHLPRPTESVKEEQPAVFDSQGIPKISYHLQTPTLNEYSQEQNLKEFSPAGEIKPTSNLPFPNNQYAFTRTSSEQHPTEYPSVSSPQQEILGITPTSATTKEAGFRENSNSQETSINSEERRPSFISFQNVQSTPESLVSLPNSSVKPTQEYFVSTPVINDQSSKVEHQMYSSVTPQTVTEVSENLSTQTYKFESVPENLAVSYNRQHTTERQSQTLDENLSNDHRSKLTNPSIVRVRTRARGRPRGQINFAASQTTTFSPDLKPNVEVKSNGHPEEDINKGNTLRDHSIKTLKFNQYRGLKKTVRTTTEATTEAEQKANVYTIRPQRRPLNPSTVSTKRIRRPTTPISTAETATENYGISTPGHYSYSADSGFSPSGVSNDVYYDHTSSSPVRHKFRKHFGLAEHKSDVVGVQDSTTHHPALPQSHLTVFQEEYAQPEVNIEKEFADSTLEVQENADSYPEWNPSESGIDISGIVLTTPRSSNQEDELEQEEIKKFQESKKAFDPDLDKKSGRRRVRVRVHKRPHENFETAESQNLRTVANVLVPPTSTYKPNDENNVHQLAKNSDFLFGAQKPFGIRSREYFRKRLNLTDSETAEIKKTEEEQIASGVTNGEGKEKLKKVLGYVRKTEKNQKNDNEATPALNKENNVSETEGNKILRTKHRGYIRKIIKHRGGNKEVDSELNKSSDIDNEDGKQENGEFQPRHQFKVNFDNFNQTGRVNGTKHRTFVRLVKKNKIKPHEVESHVEAASEEHNDEASENVDNLSPSTESVQQISHLLHINESASTTSASTTTQLSREESELPQFSVDTQRTNIQPTLESDNSYGKVAETTEQINNEFTKTSTTEEPAPGQLFRNLFQPSKAKELKESGFQQAHLTQTTQITPVQTQNTESQQKSKFFQSLRPTFQRPPFSGYQRTKEQEYKSFSPQPVPEIQEKRDGPILPKFGKTSRFGFKEDDDHEKVKKTNEQQTEQQFPKKNLHTLEVRKYLRTKNREGAFSQFSKNRFYTSEKTETVATTKEENEDIKDSEENTTPFEKSSALKDENVSSGSSSTETKPPTTLASAVSTDFTEETTSKTEEDFELYHTTTELIDSSEEEEESTEYDDSEDNNLSTETTTESKTEVPTTPYKTSTPEAIENLTKIQTEEETSTDKILEENTKIEPDLYRFSKSSFSFDESENFTGTKNRAHVRNITADIIENTASFSAPGLEKHIVSSTSDEEISRTTESSTGITNNEKTEEATTEYTTVEATTDHPETTDRQATDTTEPLTKDKSSKLIKTSTTTKISHETEICYKGKCIRTKSENPDEDLKLLVDSANIMKIEKHKT